MKPQKAYKSLQIVRTAKKCVFNVHREVSRFRVSRNYKNLENLKIQILPDEFTEFEYD